MWWGVLLVAATGYSKALLVVAIVEVADIDFVADRVDIDPPVDVVDTDYTAGIDHAVEVVAAIGYPAEAVAIADAVGIGHVVEVAAAAIEKTDSTEVEEVAATDYVVDMIETDYCHSTLD